MLPRQNVKDHPVGNFLSQGSKDTKLKEKLWGFFLRSTKFTMQLKISHFNRQGRLQKDQRFKQVLNGWDARIVTTWQTQRPLPFR